MAFFSLLLYIVCIYLRPAEWIPGMYGWQILDILAFTAFFSWLATFMMKKRIDTLKAPQNILMIGLFLAFLLSHIVHTYFEGLMWTFTEFGKLFLMYILLVLIIDSEKKLKIAVYLLIFLTLLLAIQGIQQFYTGYGWAGQAMHIQRYEEINANTGLPLVATPRINWISIFNDPNDLGLALVIVVAIILAFIFGKTKFMTKLMCVPILGTLLYAIYLTNSRGALLSLMATGAFFFIKRIRWKAVGLTLGIIFIVLVFAFGPSRLASLSSDEESANNRIDAWYYGVELTKENPIFGIGYKMFMDDFHMTAHNTFVLVMAESGIFGLFFWVGLLLISFKGLSIIQKKRPELSNYAYGLQAALVGFASASFFLSRLVIPIPYILFALSASLFTIAKMKDNTLVNEIKFRDVRNIGFATLGVVAFFYSIIKITL